VPVAHTYNPSYSGGKDEEDWGSKAGQANSSRDPISKKNPSQKRAGGVAQGIGPEFKPQYYKIHIYVYVFIYKHINIHTHTHIILSHGLLFAKEFIVAKFCPYSLQLITIVR
jgi:hypothetical protein